MRFWGTPVCTLSLGSIICAGVLLVISLPGTVDHVGMNGICLRPGHMQMGEGELRRVRESRHSLIPVRSREHNGVPLRMHFRRSVTEIRNRAIQNPCTAAI